MYIKFVVDFNAEGLGLFKKGSIHKAINDSYTNYIIPIKNDMDIDSFPVAKILCEELTENDIRKLKLKKLNEN